MANILAGRLRTRITIQAPKKVRDPAYGSWIETGAWDDIDTVWAEVIDARASRGENIGDGIKVAKRASRVTMRFRTDIDATMRIQIDSGFQSGRTMRIVTNPAVTENGSAIEVAAEELTTSGQEP